jgi:hypothetical protein
MAGPVELYGIDPRQLGQPIKRKVPSQRVPPFLQQTFNGLRLPHLVIEPHDKPVPPPNALPENRVG